MTANETVADKSSWFHDLFLGSLARTASTLFAFIIIVTLTSAGYSLVTSAHEKALRDDMNSNEARKVRLLVELTALQKKIQIDVIQVQQFLSDYSATRGLDGQEDGLPNAEKFAQKFVQDTAAAKKTAGEFGAPALVDVLGKLEKQFPAFYSGGVAMAKVYAADGPSEGNKLMQAFDKISDQMQEALNHSDEAFDDAKKRWEAANANIDAELDALRSKSQFASLLSISMSVLACIFGIVAVRFWIVSPISRVASRFMQLANGSKSVAVETTNRRDEIGNLIQTFNKFRAIVLEAEAGRIRAREQDELLESEHQRAEAERERLEADKSESLFAMIEQVEKETKSVVKIVVEQIMDLTNTTTKMSDAADRLGDTSSFVTNLAGEALNTTRSALDSTQALSTSIELVAARVQDAKAVSDEAVTVSQQANGNIEALSKSVTEIDEVTSLIMSIARQTGLLALNAGVEAARAGDQGLGFAILAKEVKSLSEKTFEATTRIGQLITQVRTSANSTVESVNDISSAVDRVSQASEEIFEAIREQVETTKRIASDVQGTTTAITNVAQQIRHVDNEVNGTRSMAKNVENVCSDVSNDVGLLQKTLVKIVRTCSAVVDRRAHLRTPLNTTGSIDIGGKAIKVSVIDVSEGGAQISGQIPPHLTSFNLRVSGFRLPIPARLVSMEDHIANVAFEVDEMMVAKIRTFLDNSTPSVNEIVGLRMSA